MKKTKIAALMMAVVLFIGILPLTVFAGWAEPLYVCGVQVTSSNFSDILGDGSCSYEIGNNTLYIYGDIINDGYGSIALVYSALTETLTVRAENDAALYDKGAENVIYASGDLIITGPGHLGVFADNSLAAICSRGDLTIDDANLYVDGYGYGIIGETLTISNSYVTAYGTEEAVKGSSGFSLGTDTGISYPYDGQVTATGILDEDGLPATEVDLVQVVYYNLWVCGKQVSNANESNITGDFGFTYDPATNVLYVFVDSFYEFHDSPFIENNIPGLTINFYSDPILNAIDANGIVLHADATITGAGQVEGTNGIYVDNCHLTIENCILDAKGRTGYGIVGNKSATLSFKNSDIMSSGNAGAISGINVVDFGDCSLIEPSGGKFSGGAVVDSQNAIAKQCTIAPQNGMIETYGIFVAGVEVNENNCNDILGNGVFSYDPSSYTLSVKGSCNDYMTRSLILNQSLYGLIIDFNDNCTLASGLHVIETAGPLYITGGGNSCTLSADRCAIYANGRYSYITIANLTAKMTGRWGIAGEFKGEFLSISHSNLDIDTVDGAICDLGRGIVLDDCFIAEPKDAYISYAAAVQGLNPAPKLKIKAFNNPFVDVRKEDYFYNPVMWAINTDPVITMGTDGTHFSPNASCTRAQMVTFLWRAAGEPTPMSSYNPFTDVKSDDYYYNAVLWAVEKGITKGTSDTAFSPNATVTRAQSVTFLYRYAGEPTVMNGTTPFTDIKPGEYYYNAVLWASDRNITKGTSETKFSPNADCTRAQIVTFLYR